ncbi:MAG TPA: hypothetical protein VH590_07280 [Ktedonobacterales bacterium]
MEAPHPDHQATQLQPPPPPPPSALNATVRASAPPAGDFPPAYGGTPTMQTPSSGDAYASQYATPPAPSSFSQYGGVPPASGPQNQYTPPPVYVPGPPPPVTPGGVAPWAQPQKSRGRKNIFIVLLVAVILIAACGGTAYALLHGKSKNTATGSSIPGTSNTPGTGATAPPAATNTPAPSGAAQKLDNINRVGVYGGIMFTVKSALQAKSVPEFQNGNPDQDDILKISVGIDFEGFRYGGFIVNGRVMGPDQRPIERGIGHGNPKDEVPGIFGDPLQLPNAAFYFEVPNTVKITDWTLVIGEATEVQMVIPLTGNYDPTFYQEATHTMGLNEPVTYNKGAITGVITKIITVVWNPCGCQAPKGMRFLRLYFHVTNNTAAPAFVGDGTYAQYILIYPNGDRMQADTKYNAHIDATVNGQESKDVGFDSWVIPADPAAYQIVFLEPDGTVVKTIDLGTV